MEFFSCAFDAVAPTGQSAIALQPGGALPYTKILQILFDKIACAAHWARQKQSRLQVGTCHLT